MISMGDIPEVDVRDFRGAAKPNGAAVRRLQPVELHDFLDMVINAAPRELRFPTPSVTGDTEEIIARRRR